MKNRILALLPAIALLAPLAPLAPAPANAAEVGKPAPAFAAVDSNGKTHALGDLSGKIVVLEWFSYACPFVKKFYGGDMQALQKEMTGKGVVWLTVCSSGEGKPGHMTAEQANDFLKEKGAAPTAFLLDADGKVGKALGAKVTPHMFVICPKGNLAYSGAIDSIKSTDPGDIAKATNHVKVAVEELLAGKTVTTSSTPPYGCGVKY